MTKSLRKSCSARIFDEEVNVTNRCTENYHDALVASHGSQIPQLEFFCIKGVQVNEFENFSSWRD